MTERTPSGYGPAPDPSYDAYALMERQGWEVAQMAHDSKKTGRSVNLKGKIVSYLRQAIVRGMDAFESEHGAFDRPPRAGIDHWVKLRADDIMWKTADYRKNDEMWEFEFAVTRECSAAQEKGWNIGAGMTSLEADLVSPSGRRGSASIASEIPSRYQGSFFSLCYREVLHQDKCEYFALEERGNAISGGRPFYVPVLLEKAEAGLIPRQIDRNGEKPFSRGFVEALLKRGLLINLIEMPAADEMDHGGRFLVLTAKAMVICREYLRSAVEEQTAFANSDEGKEHAAFVKAVMLEAGYGRMGRDDNLPSGTHEAFMLPRVEAYIEYRIERSKPAAREDSPEP